ncbi:MAG: hypothetical protein ACQEQD_04440 [Bacillota bacterium]
MATDFSPTNANHVVITDNDGNPVPQIFDPTANGGDGGWIALYGDDDNIQKTKLSEAVPAGSNIIGQVKLTDGTDAVVVDINGSLQIVPMDSSGTELFTDSNPGKVQQTGSNVTDEIIQKLETIIINTKNVADITNYDTLSFGTMDAGFFGIIPANEFITGEQLASDVGITQGASQFSDTPWLKFAFQEEIYIIPQKPIRYNISWDHIYEAGAVYGDGLTAGESGAEHHNLTSSSGTDLSPTVQDATVSINGNNYRVALMRGAADDPTNSFDDADIGSLGPENEWNALMLPIHEKATAGNWNYSNYAPSDVPDWGIGFSDGELITHRDFGNGSYSWCQETRDSDVSRRVGRGYGGVSYLSAVGSVNPHSPRGWRPRLQRI